MQWVAFRPDLQLYILITIKTKKLHHYTFHIEQNIDSNFPISMTSKIQWSEMDLKEFETILFERELF